MRNNDDLFRYTLRELEKKGQTELALHFQHQRMIETFNQKSELEKMKNDIIAEVLSRISIMFETSEAIKKIDALNKAIQQLER